MVNSDIQNLNYRDTIDLTLVLIYLLRKKGNAGFYDLNFLLSQIGLASSPSDAREIAKYLEARGLVQQIRTIGNVFIQLSPQGIMHVEQLIEDRTNLLGLAKDRLDHLEKTATSEEPEAFRDPDQIKKRRKHIFSILNRMLRRIPKEMAPRYHDLVMDLKILKLELEKIDPDRSLLDQKIDAISLSNIISDDLPDLLDALDLDRRRFA
tara:strand:+ start:480 stop:1103 length:624 start_codon:yes stop_codon:yes gene_type:complete